MTAPVAMPVGVSAYSDQEQHAILAVWGREKEIASLPLIPVCFIDRRANVHDTARVHAFAVVQEGAVIGEHATIWNTARVLPDAVIGARVSIGGGTEIGRGSRIGDYSRIGANVFLPPNSIVGARVFVGPGVTCTDDRHPRVPAPGDPPYRAEPPVIDDDASVGAGAILLPGVHIGRGARVAAGAVVTADVPAFTMVVGLPAKERPAPPAWQWCDPPSANAVRDETGEEVSFP